MSPSKPLPSTRWPAPVREASPPKWATRREALDALAEQATTDLIAASNRLVWRYL